MDKFRENAHVLHAAVTKRRLVATLTKRESRIQIFNSVFTRNRSKSESDESDNELASRGSQRHRSRVKARMGAKAAANSTPSVDGSVSATAPASGPQSEGVTTARDPEGLFDYLSPISSTEDDCDEQEGFFRRSVCMTFIETEIKEMPPWIEVPPLPPIEDRAMAQDFAAQTDFPLRTKADVALETDGVDFQDAETQFDVPDDASSTHLSAANTMFHELTRLIYLNELLTWYSNDPVTQTQRIKIVPQTSPTCEIISFHNFTHLQDKFAFVITDQSNIVTEIWSLSNLISPITIQTTLKTLSASKIQCSTNQTCLFLSNGVQIAIIDIPNVKLLQLVNLKDYTVPQITTISINETHLLVTDDGTFFYFSITPDIRMLKSFQKSPVVPSKLQKTLLLNNEITFALCSDASTFILSAYKPDTGLHLNSTENAQFEISGSKLRRFVQLPESMNHEIIVINNSDNIETTKVLAFDCRLQVAVIIIVERFVKFGYKQEIEYRLDFTYPEIPVYFAVPSMPTQSTELFSVDNVGRISRWTLLPKNRKIRSNLVSSGVEDSFVASSLRANRFMVASAKGLTILCIKE